MLHHNILNASIYVILTIALISCNKRATTSVPLGDIRVEDIKDSDIVHFTDDIGHEVTISTCPGKVVALEGSLARIWLLSGGRLNMVTDDAFTGHYALNRDMGIASAGRLMSPNAEAIVALSPSLVLLSGNISGHKALQAILDSAHIPYAYFTIDSFNDYLRALKICTGITGNNNNYELYGLKVKEDIQSTIARVPKTIASPKMLLLRAYSTGVKAKGSNNMAGIMLHDLGCDNIADDQGSLLEDLSYEAIVERQPDYIFCVTMGENNEATMSSLKAVCDTPLWHTLKAVREGKLIVLPKELFQYKPCEHWGESYEYLYNILYGSL